MAPSFSPETQALDYRPRAHVFAGPRNDREYLMWPAYAFRVVAPQPSPGRLNLLQKAVLTALAARRLSADELSEWLGLGMEHDRTDLGVKERQGADLASYVVDELRFKRFLDQDLRPTQQGEIALEEELEAAERLEPAWVFRDPFSGELWPFLCPSLSSARLLHEGDRWPTLDLGDENRPFRIKAWWQLPPRDADGSAPLAREVLHVSRNHMLRQRRSMDLVLHEGVRPGMGVEGDLKVLERLTCIEQRPVPVFLLTYLFVPHAGAEEGQAWHACEPFGRGSDLAFKRQLCRVAEQDTNFKAVLDRLVRRTIMDSHRRMAGMVANTGELAERTLAGLLTAEFRNTPVHEPLKEALEAWLELETLEDGGSRWRQRSVLTACRISLERLFASLRAAWPLAGVQDQVSTDREVNSALLEGVATDLGLELPLPGSLGAVTPRQLEAVTEFNAHSKLRPLVVGTMLAACRDGAHPMWQAAVQVPDLVHRVDEVANRTGPQVHDSQQGAPGLSQIEQCIDHTVAVAGALLGYPARTLKQVRGMKV